MVHREEWVQEIPLDHRGLGGLEEVVHRNMDTTMIVDLLLVMAVVAVDMMIVVHRLAMVVAVDLMIVAHHQDMVEAGAEDTMIVGLHLGIISVGDMVVVVVVTMMVDMEVIGREEDHLVRQDVGGTNWMS